MSERFNPNYFSDLDPSEVQSARADEFSVDNKRLAVSPRILPLCLTPASSSTLNNDAVFRIGVSVGKRVPVRVLGYPILAYELLQENPGARLEIYVATEFCGLNGIDSSTAEASKATIEKWIPAFIEQFIPRINERVSFIPTSQLTSERMEVLDNLVEVIKCNPEIYEFCQLRNGQDSLRYIAAHSLYMRDPLPLGDEIFLTPRADSPSGSPVMIGGPQERLTRIARSLIRRYFCVDEVDGEDIATTVGRVPPYYESRKYAEPYLDEGNELAPDYLLRERTIPEMYQDLATILAFINGVPYESVWRSGAARLRNRASFLESVSLDELNEFLRDGAVK